MGTAALILSILGIIGCIPLVGGILGIVFGKMGMKAAEEGRATNAGQAKAGFIIGIIGLVLWVILGIIYFVFIAAIVASNTTITQT